jgi:hypothetical protein
MKGPFFMYCSAGGMVVGSMKSVMKVTNISLPDAFVLGLEGVCGLFMMNDAKKRQIKSWAKVAMLGR